MFVIGDQVTVKECSEKKYIGNYGEVIFIGEAEASHIIRLDTGKVLRNLQEKQLSKLEENLSKAKGRKEKEKAKNQAKEKKQGADKQAKA